MNKNRYRIVFNQARGLLMAVAEIARSPDSSVGTTEAASTNDASAQQSYQTDLASITATLRPLAFSVWLATGAVALVSQAAQADIMADGSAPANQRPIILNAANGVPQVNIQTPSAAGVSRNTYSQFDVQQQGAILNNSRTNVQTQLGGYIQANPYLATGTARVILNEVNANNPSLLQGYVEVAGSRAQVVIANPAGVTCDGCGFINANRATLTTGTPILNGGSLDGYRVQRGSVSITGNGLDASQTDYTDIIARAVQVNASIYANDLRVTAGSNQVAVASNGNSTSTTPIAGTGSTPTIAIDVAQLGGMYAGKIQLIGTEAGVGVTNAGQIGASAGDVVVNVNGQLTNSGTISSTGSANNVAIQAQGLNNSGTLSSQNTLSIDNQGDVQNSGLITADVELDLNTTGALSNTSGTLSAQRLDIAAASLTNLQGIIRQTGLQALSLSTQSLHNINAGVIGNLTVDTSNSGSGSSSGGSTSSGTTGSGSGSSTTTPPSSATGGGSVNSTPITAVVLADGVITIEGDANNDGGQITANGSMRVSATTSFNNSAVINAYSLSFSGNSFSNANGKLNVAQANINTSQFDNSLGQFIASNQLNLQAHDVVNAQGSIQQLGTTDLTIDLAGNLDNTQGHIDTNAANLTLKASTLTNTAGSITHAGAEALTIDADTLSGTKGTINTNGALNITATNAILDQGTTTAQQLSLNTATLSNQGGQIIQTGTGTTSITATTLLNNNGGSIASNGNTSYSVGSLNNQAGTIQAAGTADLIINATGALDNSATGKLQAGGSTNLTAASLNNQQGQLTAGNTLTVTTVQGLNNIQGMIAANQGVSINAGADVNNSSGSIASVHAGLNLTTTGSIANTSGTITAAQSLNTNSFGFNNSSGTLLSNDALLNSQSLGFTNSNGTIMTTASLALQTGALLNDAGLIQSGSNLTLNTHGQTLTNTSSGTAKGIVSQGSATLSTGDLNNQGGYIGTKGTLIAALSSNNAAITNTNGVITSEAAISLQGSSLNNQSGRIESLGNLDISTVGGTNSGTNNQSGLLRSDQALTLTAAAVDNRNTQSTNLGIQANNVAIVADSINNTVGAIRADNLLAITDSGTLDNTQGLISSSNTLTIADRLAQASSNVAGKTLAITNTSGTLTAGTNLAASLTIDSSSLTGDGSVVSTGDLTTKLTSNYTQTGIWQANGNATFVTSGTLINQATLSAGQTLNVTAGSVDNRAGASLVGNNVNLTTANTLTNRGLINGSNTFINAATLNNIGTGRIYGDHIAINTGTLINDTETVNGVSSAAVIAARNRLDIGANTITNREHAMLYSGGDMAIGGSLDGNYLATGSATTLNNNSATINALGNLALNVNQINNTNEHFSTQVVQVSSSFYQLWQTLSPDVGSAVVSGKRWTASQKTLSNTINDSIWFLISPDGFSDHFYQFNINETVTETQVATSDPGQILSGQGMQITASNVNNNQSQIIAGGALTGTIGTLSNTSVSGERITSDTGSREEFSRRRKSGADDQVHSSSPYSAQTVESITLSNSVFLQNTASSGGGTSVATLSTSTVGQTASGANSASASVNSASSQTATTQLGSVNATSAAATSNVTQTVNPNVTLPNNSLYHTNPNSTNHYLVETDPAFANYRTWLSSDYLLQQLSYDPATAQKRLGDGFYEQNLIRDQVAQLTGRRFLNGYASDEAQYQGLLNNAVTVAKAWNLQPGIALSAAQVAELTSDIVWLVQKTITLPDGSTTQALVPQVYVSVQPGDVNTSGALISANSINLNINGNLNNSGTIAGRTVLALNAVNVNNLGGNITATDVNVNASNDINNIGGTITGQNSLVATAGRDLNVISTTSTQTSSPTNQPRNNSTSITNINRVAGLYVTGDQGLLVATAGRDINLTAAKITSAGSVSLTAVNDLNLKTVTTAQSDTFIRDAKNYLTQTSTQDNGTQITSTNNLTLNAGHDINTRAATLTSDQGAVNANAGNDIHINSGQNTLTLDTAFYQKSSGFLSSRSLTQQAQRNDTSSVSSTLSGDRVNLNANNIKVTGSNVVSTSGTTLNATTNINIEAAQNTNNDSQLRQEKKSGLLGTGGGLGFSIGSQQQGTNQTSNSTTNTASTIGSTNGDVNINAGKAYTQTGSNVLAPTGNITIAAQSVDINAAQNTTTQTSETKFKQTGLTVSLSNPVVSAVQTTQQMATAASQTSDPRMQALAAGTTALAAKNAYDAVQTGQGTTINDKPGQIATGQDAAGNPTSRDATALDKLGGVTVSVSLGTSKSQSNSSETSTTAQGSTVSAGKNITITATGAGTNSNLNVTGSTIQAGNNVTLKADNQINLLAAQNTDTQTSTNSSSSASVGASFGLGAGGSGLGLNASTSKGKGNANGTDVSWTETLVQGGNNAGDKVRLQSGTDTNLIGAQVKGNQVIANVGTSGTGNLNIQSLQDTSTYKSQQTSSSASISAPIGAGSYGASMSNSKSNVNSNYASVNEQAGIFSGDAGFQVNVNGNTNLTGAVIGSPQTAIDNNKNSLITKTLTTSTIQNTSDYNATSENSGINLSFDNTKSITRNIGNNLVSLPGALTPDIEKQDSESSVTHSAISQGTLIITDSAKQQELTGANAETTVATLDRDTAQANPTALTRPDISTIEKTMAAESTIISAATQELTKAVNNYYEKRVSEYDEQYNQKIKDAQTKEAQANQLTANGDTEAARQLTSEAQSLRAQAVDIRNERDNPTVSQGLTLALGSALISGLGTGQVDVGNAATTYSVGTLGDKFLLVAQKRDTDVAQGFIVKCNDTPATCAKEASKLKDTNNSDVPLEKRIQALENLQTKDTAGNTQPLFQITIVDSNSAGNKNVGVNGILNEPDRAMVLAIGELRDGNKTGQELYLSYNDTQGTIADLLNAAIDKYTNSSSNPSLMLGQALIAAKNGDNNAQVYLYAHSGGTLISTIALNSLGNSGQTISGLHVDYFGPAASISSATGAAINAAGLSNASTAEKLNWLKYGNTTGLPKGIDSNLVQDYINNNHGAGYYNHTNDPVATFVGGNFGANDSYQGINLAGQLSGSETRNTLQSMMEIQALLNTNNSAHSTYRWNDPKTWPTQAVTPAPSNTATSEAP